MAGRVPPVGERARNDDSGDREGDVDRIAELGACSPRAPTRRRRLRPRHRDERDVPTAPGHVDRLGRVAHRSSGLLLLRRIGERVERHQHDQRDDEKCDPVVTSFKVLADEVRDRRPRDVCLEGLRKRRQQFGHADEQGDEPPEHVAVDFVVAADLVAHEVLGHRACAGIRRAHSDLPDRVTVPPQTNRQTVLAAESAR